MGTGNRERGTRNGELGVGNGKQGTGNGERGKAYVEQYMSKVICFQFCSCTFSYSHYLLWSSVVMTSLWHSYDRKEQAFFLKLELPYVRNSLAFLFHTSIETSCFSDSWKASELLQVSKIGMGIRRMSLIDQYQSCLSSQGSLKIYFPTSCANQYMNCNGHFSSGQSCFLRINSTAACLLKNTPRIIFP